jgi:excinuclease ABC subunit C
MVLSDQLRERLAGMPDAPGCYLMRDRLGRIVYVGKAASLRQRVRSYFRPATWRHASPKVRGLLESVHDIEYLVTRSVAEAALTEGRLIKEYKPRFNVSFRDDKRFLLLRADPPSDPFPRLNLCRIARRNGARYFGPYASAAAARATLDFVEKRYGLRKCLPRVPDAETYRHCLNDVIRYCSAPCIGKVDAEAYRRCFDEACACLAGERPGVLEEVRRRMLEASDQGDYERAAVWRDTWLSLRATVQARARVAVLPRLDGPEARHGLAELQAALGLARQPRRIEGYDVSNIGGVYAVASLVCFVDGEADRRRYRRFRIRTVSAADDPRMIAEVIERRFTRLLAERQAPPDLIVVDGGAAQVGAAARTLQRLGLNGVATAGLAKRLEDVYLPKRRHPIRLPASSPALRLLQRLRDEAHRFALTYHRSLRWRRLRESVLDEIPGVGPRRKQQLLQRFGSVRRLAAASVDEIAGVTGFGEGLARAVREALMRQTGRPGRAGAPTEPSRAPNAGVDEKKGRAE